MCVFFLFMLKWRQIETKEEKKKQFAKMFREYWERVVTSQIVFFPFDCCCCCKCRNVFFFYPFRTHWNRIAISSASIQVWQQNSIPSTEIGGLFFVVVAISFTMRRTKYAKLHSFQNWNKSVWQPVVADNIAAIVA